MIFSFIMSVMISIERIGEIKENIALAEKKSGRGLGSVKLMAVSKTRTRDEVLDAIKLGFTLFGENRVIEAVEKFSGIENVKVDLIGHLQSNKVSKAVPFFNTIESVDSFKLAKKISDRAVLNGVVQDILLEQNCSGESSKSGFLSTIDLFKNCETIRLLPGLRIMGLMTIAPNSDNEKDIRASFSLLRDNFEKLKKSEGLSWMDILSMGMSNDYVIAIEEGSSLVRLGRTIFGERDYV